MQNFPSKHTDFSHKNRVGCIILAGGQGTRLYPLTKMRCKPAVRFGGRYRLIDIPISNALHANMKNIIVISQFFSSGLNQHIKNTYPIDHFQGGNLMLLHPEEREEKIWYQGTADAIRKNLIHLAQLPVDYFLILSGDQLYNMDLEAMVSFAREKNADLTIASIPVAQENASRFGLLNIDNASNILSFYEKPQDPMVLKQFQLSKEFIKSHQIEDSKSPHFLASMGIYVFKKEVLQSLLLSDEGHDFGKDLIPKQIQKGRAAAYLHQGYWEDIGTISSFYEANLALTTHQTEGMNLYDEVLPIFTQNHYLPGAKIGHTAIHQSIICEGCFIDAKEIDHSVIGMRTTLKKGSTIKDSILLGNASYTPSTDEDPSSKPFTIGENCRIEHAIIDENATIGNHVTLINEKNKVHYDGECGVLVRDGIIIVPSHAQLPDHFTF